MNELPEWEPIYKAARDVITEVMTAGHKQRLDAGRPTNEWMNMPPADRLQHAFMHLVSCKTNEVVAGTPWSLTANTHLEDYKHALTGLAIVCAVAEGYLEESFLEVDTTEDEIKAE